MYRIVVVLSVSLLLVPLATNHVYAQQDLSGVEKLFKKNCTICHSARRALKKVKDRTAWEDTVGRMSERFAIPIPWEDQAAIVSYLYGRNLFSRACTSCHDADRAMKLKQDRDGWGPTVDKMVGLGAVLVGENRDLMIDYLTGVAGK